MKARRGVSEIVATLMILLTVSTLGVVLYNYALGLTYSQESSLIYETDFQENLSRERLTILSVTRTVDNRMNITVINYGEIDIVLDDLYVNNAHYDINDLTVTDLVITWLIPDLTLPDYSGNNQIKYEIMLVSQRGVKFAYEWKN